MIKTFKVNILYYELTIVIAWARVPHIGYWHCSGLESEAHARPEGSKPLQFKYPSMA